MASSTSQAIRYVRPMLEELESRVLLAAPQWSFIGPAPLQDPNGLTSIKDNPSKAPVSGRVSALAYSIDIGNHTPAMFLGSASGGIWRTKDYKTWMQVSDNLFTKPNGAGRLVDPADAPGAPDIGSLAVDPNDPSIIYAGTGEATDRCAKEVKLFWT